MADSSLSTPFLYAQRLLLEMQAAGALDKGLPISIDDVAAAAIRVSDVANIRFLEVPVSSKGLRAVTIVRDEAVGERTERRADIIVTAGLHPWWSRFVICKELCQIVLSDIESSRTGAPEEIVGYLTGLLDQSLYRPFSPALQTDHFATICAIEVLCPYNLRQPLYNSLLHKEISTFEIAHEFQIPESIVEGVFSEGYHENARQSLAAERLSEFRFDPKSRWLNTDLQLMFQRNVQEALRENAALGESTADGG